MEEATHFRVGGLFEEARVGAGSNQVPIGGAEVNGELIDVSAYGYFFGFLHKFIGR